MQHALQLISWAVSEYRKGVSAVVANVGADFGPRETMVVFTVPDKKARHMQMYENVALRENMPLITSETAEHVYTYVPLVGEFGRAAHACVQFPIQC
jgi:hypothetical protein